MLLSGSVGFGDMYTVVDIETTGLSKNYHQITEIAAVKVRGGKVTDSFETLVNPQTRIPSFISKLTGINDSMVRNAPVISKVVPSFVDFLGSDVFVAHNATFDFGFLEHNARRLGSSLVNPRLCTKKLATRMFPELAHKRLSDLCSHLNVTHTHAHRAMGDVTATALAFNQMLDILHSRGVSEVADVLKFERAPAKHVSSNPIKREI